MLITIEDKKHDKDLTINFNQVLLMFVKEDNLVIRFPTFETELHFETKEKAEDCKKSIESCYGNAGSVFHITNCLGVD